MLLASRGFQVRGVAHPIPGGPGVSHVRRGVSQAGRLACMLAVVAAAAAAVRRSPVVRRVVVEGDSMLPTLAPGDRLLVAVRRGPRHPPPEVGELVVTPDPRRPARLVVKRVAAVDARTVELVGDNADHSTDSRVFGRVAISALEGRAVYRYAPAQRAGRLRRARRSLPAGTIAGAWPSPG